MWEQISAFNSPKNQGIKPKGVTPLIKEICMKKIVVFILYMMIMSGLFGQTRVENSWLIGTWVDNNKGITLVLNDDGTGRWTQSNRAINIFFSIHGDTINIFTEGNNTIGHFSGNYSVITSTVYRISDQRLILRLSTDVLNFVKMI
jgi:hypothetical protein